MNILIYKRLESDVYWLLQSMSQKLMLCMPITDFASSVVTVKTSYEKSGFTQTDVIVAVLNNTTTITSFLILCSPIHMLPGSGTTNVRLGGMVEV